MAFSTHCLYGIVEAGELDMLEGRKRVLYLQRARWHRGGAPLPWACVLFPHGFGSVAQGAAQCLLVRPLETWVKAVPGEFLHLAVTGAHSPHVGNITDKDAKKG